MPTGINQYIAQRRTQLVNPVVPQFVAEQNQADYVGNYVMNTLILTRAPKTVTLSIGTTPTLILTPPHNWPYLLSNPGLSIGLTNSIILASGTAIASGNTQLTPIGVSNYLEAHWHLTVTAVTGTWDFIQQSEDPATLAWADNQTIFSAVGATGTTYAFTGQLGLASDLAIRWIQNTPATSIDFSLTVTLKEGVGGGPTGLAKTIFIGGNDVNISNGLPILEGQDRILLLGPDLQIYAISAAATTIQVFVL